jgi:hypothetical protein
MNWQFKPNLQAGAVACSVSVLFRRDLGAVYSNHGESGMLWAVEIKMHELNLDQQYSGRKDESRGLRIKTCMVEMDQC